MIPITQLQTLYKLSNCLDTLDALVTVLNLFCPYFISIYHSHNLYKMHKSYITLQKLPDLLPNLQVPCWVEDVPTDFSYDDNIYHCHINNRRIKQGFETMHNSFKHRQSYHGFKWRIRCLPSFYLIGVAKCGTTDLFEALTRHPQVRSSYKILVIHEVHRRRESLKNFCYHVLTYNIVLVGRN